MGSSFLPNHFAPWTKGIRIPRRKHWQKLKDARSYFVGLYMYGCRLPNDNQAERINLLLVSFSFSPLTYSGTNYITETILLAHETRWPTYF